MSLYFSCLRNDSFYFYHVTFQLRHIWKRYVYPIYQYLIYLFSTVISKLLMKTKVQKNIITNNFVVREKIKKNIIHYSKHRKEWKLHNFAMRQISSNSVYSSERMDYNNFLYTYRWTSIFLFLLKIIDPHFKTMPFHILVGWAWDT